MRYIIEFYAVVDKERKRWKFLKDKTLRIEAKNDEEAIRKCKRRGGSFLVRSECMGRVKKGKQKGKKWYKQTPIYHSKKTFNY